MLCILVNCLQRQSGLDKDTYQKIDVKLHNWPLVMFRLWRIWIMYNCLSTSDSDFSLIYVGINKTKNKNCMHSTKVRMYSSECTVYCIGTGSICGCQISISGKCSLCSPSSRCTIRGPSSRCVCLFSAVGVACSVYTESFAPLSPGSRCLFSPNTCPAIAVACHVQTAILPVQSKQ
jgi:hypothetical protein